MIGNKVTLLLIYLTVCTPVGLRTKVAASDISGQLIVFPAVVQWHLKTLN